MIYLSVQNISKSFGPVSALQNVSFQIQRGEAIGFLGPNGAGKTTMMRIITGFFPPTEGNVLIDGQNLFESGPEIKKKIGYLPEHNPLYYDMTGKEFLVHTAKLKAVPPKKRAEAIERVVSQCGIENALNRIVGKLSKGYQQRMGLAQALIGDPDLLILDEPTNGLDPQQMTEIRNLIRKLSGDRTILLSTHILSEVQMTCERILILNQGRLIASGKPHDLEEKLKREAEFIVHLRGPWEKGDQFLKQVSGVIDVQLEAEENRQRKYRIRTEQGRDVQADVVRAAMNEGFELLELKACGLSLEDIFLHMVKSEDSKDHLNV